MVTTYKISASSYGVGSTYPTYAASKTTTYNCPNGTQAVLTYSKSIPNTCGGMTYGDFCRYSVINETATVTAYVRRSVFYSSCVSPCCPSATIESSCTRDGDHQCSVINGFQMEFQCGKKEEVGTTSNETCSYPTSLSGAACQNSGDDAFCSAKCTGVGWVNGEASACTPNKNYNQGGSSYWNRQCGVTNIASYSYDPESGATQPYHDITCRCWN